MIRSGGCVRGDERLWVVEDFVQPPHFIQQPVDGFGSEQFTQPLVYGYDQVSGLPAGVHPGFCQENAHHAPIVCVGPALNPAHFFKPPEGAG